MMTSEVPDVIMTSERRHFDFMCPLGSKNFRILLLLDGWMFEFFVDAQPHKGHIASKRLYKNTILHYELVWKKIKIFKIDRIIRTIGMTIKT